MQNCSFCSQAEGVVGAAGRVNTHTCTCARMLCRHTRVSCPHVNRCYTGTSACVHGGRGDSRTMGKVAKPWKAGVWRGKSLQGGPTPDDEFIKTEFHNQKIPSGLQSSLTVRCRPSAASRGAVIAEIKRCGTCVYGTSCLKM